MRVKVSDLQSSKKCLTDAVLSVYNFIYCCMTILKELDVKLSKIVNCKK